MPDETAVDELLSRPTRPLVEALGALEGDLLILGAGGKMGPSLGRLAHRATREAGVPRRIVAVSRFSDRALRDELERAGVETVASDLLEPDRLASLPEAPNVVLMAGQKFGATGDAPRTWVTNALLPGLAAARFCGSRIVAFSTGNVYPLWPADSDGPTETDPPLPVGEYAQSALARERILEFCSRRHATPMALRRRPGPGRIAGGLLSRPPRGARAGAGQGD